MKNNSLPNELNTKRKNVGGITLLVAFFLLATTTFAQVIPERVREIPTEAGVPTTEFLIVSHATDSSFHHSLFNSRGMFKSDDVPVEYTQGGDYVEYQVVSPTGGQFAAVLLLSTRTNPGEVNVSVYKTETEVWSETGITLDAYNNSWTNFQEHVYLLGTLEAGTYYTVRITWKHGVNFNGIKVIQTEGSSDATLSDIKIDGETIEGFDPEILEYTILLEPGAWINSIEAVPNHELATTNDYSDVTLPADPNVGSKTSIDITVTSESGITKDYIVNVVTPIEIADFRTITGLALGGSIINDTEVRIADNALHVWRNGMYVDYYVYSSWEGNFSMAINGALGIEDADAYINVSTYPLGEEENWSMNPINSLRCATTYNTIGEPTYDEISAVEQKWYFSLKAEEPRVLRIYCHGSSRAMNMYGITFNEVFESIDGTLSNLQVDGSTVEGFDPYKLTYSIALPKDASTVNIVATTTDNKASVESGVGVIDVSGDITRDTISVISEVGREVNYFLSLIKPVEVTGDSLKLLMGDQVFKNEGASPTNAFLNGMQDGDYVEYYIYSETAKDVHLLVSAVNGNPDTVYSKLYVSAYEPGSEWDMNQATEINIPHTELNMWSIDYATDVKCNLSLEAGKAVKLRLYANTNAGNTLANIYGLTIVDGATETSATDLIRSNALKVWGGTDRINVQFDETYLGATVQIYDITGSLVTRRIVNELNGVYQMGQKGLYFVKVMGANKQATTVKCIVK